VDGDFLVHVAQVGQPAGAHPDAYPRGPGGAFPKYASATASSFRDLVRRRCYKGSLLAADVLDMVSIQVGMGHSIRATTGRYLHGSHTSALDCIPAGSARHPVGFGLYGCTMQTSNDAQPWWLAVGPVEALTIVVTLGVGGSARRKSQSRRVLLRSRPDTDRRHSGDGTAGWPGARHGANSTDGDG